mgnify:CR=1 FL=1|tara:strand:+ start:560 stop:1264 length:705 start_codon:yes stop_codon:yes gene_type:complete
MAGIKTGIDGQINNNIQTLNMGCYFDASINKSFTPGDTSMYNLASGSLTPTGSLLNDIGFHGPLTASWVFDGVDDEVKYDEYTTGQAFTIAWWAKLPNLGSGASYILNKGGSNNIMYNSNEILYVEASNTTSYIVTNDSGVPNVFDNTWHYFVMTKPSDTADAMKFYFDNEGPFDALGSMAAVSTFSFTHLMHFDAGSQPYAAGSIANLMVYNRRLSTGDILQNYNAQKDRFGL